MSIWASFRTFSKLTFRCHPTARAALENACYIVNNVQACQDTTEYVLAIKRYSCLAG